MTVAITVVVIIAGVAGGVLNALLSDSGFISPGWEEIGDKRIWKPGAIGNMVLGGAAALVSWGLYGPFSQATLLPPTSPENNKPILTLATFVGAVLVGMGGSRILTSEVEKRVLTATATTAASLESDPNIAGAIATASSPTEALRTAVEAQEAEAQEAETQEAETQEAETQG